MPPELDPVVMIRYPVRMSQETQTDAEVQRLVALGYRVAQDEHFTVGDQLWHYLRLERIVRRTLGPDDMDGIGFREGDA